MSYDTILTQQRDRVLLITLNRPEALNALNTQLSHELIDALTKADRDDGVGCIVITGSAKAFAAGADFKEMQTQSYTDMRGADFFGQWDALATLRKPTIAAVSGYALGGGCELAMMCDFILCSDTAQFGQPEIKLGVMPGMGGSQRLTRLVGQAKAMEMCFTGRMMDAAEAERAGLVSRVIPADALLDEAMTTAATIASMSPARAEEHPRRDSPHAGNAPDRTCALRTPRLPCPVCNPGSERGHGRLHREAGPQVRA